MQPTKQVMKKMKLGVKEDVYNNKKDKFRNDEYVEYVPVNMHGRPVPQGKSDENAKEVIKSINKQQRNS